MVGLKELSRKLRHIADALDEVFAGPGTPAITRQILKSKVHWTQRPENAAKVQRMARKRAAHRRQP